MPRYKILDQLHYKRQRWKNQKGVTDEIAVYPETATVAQGDFLWRLSSARVELDTEFSAFPYHHRHLVVVHGNGLRIIHELPIPNSSSAVVELNCGLPYEFSGSLVTRCELISGPIQDLGLMVKKGEWESSFEAIHVPSESAVTWTLLGPWNFAFSMEGTVDIEGHVLCATNTLEVSLNDEPCPQILKIRSLEGESRVLLMSLWPSSAVPTT